MKYIAVNAENPEDNFTINDVEYVYYEGLAVSFRAKDGELLAMIPADKYVMKNI